MATIFKTSEYSLAEKRDFAREMRRNPTNAEADLWYHLRGDKLGYRFHRQSVQRGYILDFYCPKLRLAIEVDGSVHDLEDQAAYDETKERALEECGVRMLRFSNEDVSSYATVVISRIREELQYRKGLKAVARSISTEGVTTATRSSRPCGYVDYYKRGTYSQRSVPAEQRMSADQICELDRKIRTFGRQRSMKFAAYEDTRTTAEKIFEQQHKLQEWLKKKRPNASESLMNTEPQTLAVNKGMVIT
jgi:very-short-patch-repair endonuclease